MALPPTISFDDPQSNLLPKLPETPRISLTSPNIEAKTQKQFEILKDPPPSRSTSHVRKRSWSADSMRTSGKEKDPDLKKETIILSTVSSSSDEESAPIISESESETPLQTKKIDRIYTKRVQMRKRSSGQEELPSPTKRKTDEPKETILHSESSSSVLPKRREKKIVFELNLLKALKSKTPSPRLKTGEEKTTERRLLMRRNYSFHAGTQKITSPQTAREQHTTEQLSLLSPPLTARRQYLPDSILPGKKSTKAKFDINTLEFVSNKDDAAKFDEVGKKCIRMAWSTSQKPEISSQIIEESIDKACRKEIDELFKLEKTINTYALCLTESPRTKQLLIFIKFGGIPLIQILERLVVLHKEIEQFMDLAKNKTEWSNLLYKYIGKLLEPDIFSKELAGLTKGRDLQKFLSIIDEVLEQKDTSKIKKFILMGFGDTSKTQKQVLATLRKWSDPSLNLVLELKKNVHDLSWINSEAKSIPYVEHKWYENEQSEHPLSKVTIREILRCLKPNEYIPFSKITINDHSFYIGKEDPIEIEDNDFYFDLLTEINKKGFNKKISADEVKAQVKYLLKGHLLSHTEKEIKKALPCVNVLRLTAHDSWLRGDHCIRFLYPGLFTAPFWTKALQGTECHIYISNSNDFRVELTKTYAVYYLLNPSDSLSTTPDDSRILAHIPFSWSVTPVKEMEEIVSHTGETERVLKDNLLMQGKLRILESLNLYDKLSSDEKWKILHSIINFTDAELSLEAPDTPRIESRLLELPISQMSGTRSRKAGEKKK